VTSNKTDPDKRTADETYDNVSVIIGGTFEDRPQYVRGFVTDVGL